MRWSEKVGIASAILVDVLREMDSRETCDSSEGRIPFVLLDGHRSRTDLELLKCANDPSHEWVTCAGFLHGTCLCQVGDPSEQNGYFNMEFTRAKADIMQLKKHPISQHRVGAYRRHADHQSRLGKKLC